MKTAKIQWLGNHVHVIDEQTNAEIFSMPVTKFLIDRLVGRARKRGYHLPQVYPGKDGIKRIWL